MHNLLYFCMFCLFIARAILLKAVDAYNVGKLECAGETLPSIWNLTIMNTFTLPYRPSAQAYCLTQSNGSCRNILFQPDGDATLESSNFCLHEGSLATSGMIDLRCKGFSGIDFSCPGITPDNVDHALLGMLYCGITRCLPTIIASPVNNIVAQLDKLDHAVQASQFGEHMVLGYHLEGLVLPDKTDPLSDPVVQLFSLPRFRPIRLVTIDPAIQADIELVKKYAPKGSAFAIGDTRATPWQISSAIDAGASLFMNATIAHAYASSLTDSKNRPKTLNGELPVCFSADNIQTSKEVLKLSLSHFDTSRQILVSNTVAASGPHVGPGHYTLGEIQLVRNDIGDILERNSNRTVGYGDALNVQAANYLAWSGGSLRDIAAICRDNPLKVLRYMDWIGGKASAEVVEWRMDGDKWQVIAVHLQWRSIAPVKH